MGGKQRMWLAIIATTMATVWLVLLPWTANRPRIKSHLQWLRDQGIDPSATYYTELEVMDEILARQRNRPSDVRQSPW